MFQFKAGRSQIDENLREQGKKAIQEIAQKEIAQKNKMDEGGEEFKNFVEAGCRALAFLYRIRGEKAFAEQLKRGISYKKGKNGSIILAVM